LAQAFVATVFSCKCIYVTHVEMEKNK